MKGSKRPSDSWASGAANPRKEDFGLKVGVKSKTTSSNALRPRNHLAWYVAYNANPLEKKLPHMPRIKWKCPPKLVLDPSWHVACGEESSEIDTQKYRETTVIEAVYPHLSTIPPSPLISPDMEGKRDDDDSQIPLIPLVPIEESGEIEMPLDTSAPIKTFNCHSTSESLTDSRFNSSVSPNPPTGENSLLNVLHGLEGSDLAVVAGAAAAVAAAVENKHEIDTELLIKFLADPEMMKRLIMINETGVGAKSGPGLPSGPNSTAYTLSSNSTPDPGLDIPVPVAMNQPVPIKESASDLCVAPAKCARICSPNLMKNWTPAPPRSNSHPPLIQDLKNEATEPTIAHPRTHGTTGTNESRSLTFPTTLSYNENHHARLTDPVMVKTLVNETVIGANSGPKSAMHPLSSNSTSDPGIDISAPVAMNQPIPIKESAGYLGVTPAKRARICSPNLMKNWSPVPSRSSSHPPLIQNLKNEARETAIAHPKTHGPTGTNEPRPLTSPTALNYNENHYARRNDPEMVKTLVNETGIGANFEPRFSFGPKSSIYPLSSNSTPDPGINIFMPMTMNQSIPIKGPAGGLGVTPANRVCTSSPNLVKNWSPVPPRSNFHPPLIQDLTNEAREPVFARSRAHGTTGTNEPRPLTAPTLSYNENQYAGLINQYRVPPIQPLYPSFSKPNWEEASKPIVKHPPPFTWNPVSSPPPFSSTWRPYMHCVTDGYRTLDHSGLKPGLGSNPSMPFALELNCTSSGTFHSYPSPSMNKLPPPVGDINHIKSLIMHHGEKNIRNEDKLPIYGQTSNHFCELELAQHTNPLQINPTFQKPCKFFNSSNGCRKGSNCKYVHVMSRR